MPGRAPLPPGPPPPGPSAYGGGAGTLRVPGVSPLIPCIATHYVSESLLQLAQLHADRLLPVLLP